jgi:hypothetical protein
MSKFIYFENEGITVNFDYVSKYYVKDETLHYELGFKSMWHFIKFQDIQTAFDVETKIIQFLANPKLTYVNI